MTNTNKISITPITAHYNRNGDRALKYTCEIHHSGLNEKRLLSAPTIELLENKAQIQEMAFLEKEDKRLLLMKKEATIKEAERQNEAAKAAIEKMNRILSHTLSVDDRVDWDALKKFKAFKEPKPNKAKEEAPPEKPEEEAPLVKPEKNPVKFTLLDWIFKSMKERKIARHKEMEEARLRGWRADKNRIDDKNQKNERKWKQATEAWETRKEKNEREWKQATKAWETRKENFYAEQDEFNRKIDGLRDSYMELNPDSVSEYCDMVLNNSRYPARFPKSYELEYDADSKTLIVDYQLPSADLLPKVKSVKYVAARKEIVKTHISDRQLNQMFDEAIYQIALRSLHELFEADVAGALDAIAFNGLVTAINKGTGNEECNCILSAHVKKEDFLEFNLHNVDPKTCFKSLKGVAAAALSELTPVRPIQQISKSDKRFVEGYNVVDSLDDTINVAAMSWEDFEHLVRELFEKEFSQNGGEVKITQASRDGGVDAIAFDPDPIRGGKIVIQAKRYTNTVGVSAVRDLYGTVVNEGATKGILVSTANYGPDAHSFAKDKPLTLLNGENLLHLLEKHGHRAKIDLQEAKKILA